MNISVLLSLLLGASCVVLVTPRPTQATVSHVKHSIINYQVQRLRELLEKNCPAEFLSDGLDISSPTGHWKRAVGVSSFEYQLLVETYDKLKSAYKRCLDQTTTTSTTTQRPRPTTTPVSDWVVQVHYITRRPTYQTTTYDWLSSILGRVREIATNDLSSANSALILNALNGIAIG